VFTPHTDGAERYYTFEGAGRLEPLLTGLIPTPGNASVAVRQDWWPQQDFLSRRVSADHVSRCRQDRAGSLDLNAMMTHVIPNIGKPEGERLLNLRSCYGVAAR
jgi:hypothetical protein